MIHADQDIGYGPPIDMPSAIKEDLHDHPLAPPVTSPDGFVDESADVSKFSSNIIMSRKSDQVREVRLFIYILSESKGGRGGRIMVMWTLSV